MNQLKDIRRSNRSFNGRDPFNSCLSDPDNSSWICDQRSLGKRLADSALKVLEESLKEYQKKQPGEND